MFTNGGLLCILRSLLLHKFMNAYLSLSLDSFLFATNWDSGSDIMYFRALLDEGNGAENLPKISDSGKQISSLVGQKKEFSGCNKVIGE